MENNEISMFMDVKVDLSERKPEGLLMRNWTKCLVKIEAIKCFPCYIRITFVRNVEDESANLCVRINIPGLSVRLARSRTKSHSYGLFWKQNRKRCCIFVAFDSQLSCDRHMRWMKKSIKNLELHRQELLEAKRNSVGKLGKTSSMLNMSKEGLEQTRNVRDLQDILGPLPKIPDFRESGNWSRRVSGMSGIYEEIPDADFVKRVSRASVASGIYEEMKPPKTVEPARENIKIAPPLPPRKRINTFQTGDGPIPRSYTNPEVDMAKKKRYLVVLENMFGRSKRSGSVSEGKVSQPNDFIEIAENQVYTNEAVVTRTKKHSKFADLAAKRNSFSTPDLTNPRLFDNFESLDDISLLSSDGKVFDLDDHTLSNECIPLKSSTPPGSSFDYDLNVSEQIQPNFNFSCNMSTVNLVGANLNSVENSPNVIVDDLAGYCVMAPIKRERKTSSDSDKENEEDTKKIDEQVYESMNLNGNGSLPPVDKRSGHIYQNLVSSARKSNISSCDAHESEDDLKKTHRKSTNIDDKVPSYYPNNCDSIKLHRRKSNSVSEKNSVRHLTSVKLSHRENLYISSPQKILDDRMKLKTGSLKTVKLRACKTSPTMYSVVKTSDGTDNNQTPNDDHEMNTKNDEHNPRIYQKYATLARLSPNKYLEKCAKKTADFGSVKKFASLPRFKKIDFSPLKIKINNVLQRHQSEGL